MPEHIKNGLGASIWLLGCTSILVVLSIKLGHTSLYVVTALSSSLLILSTISVLKNRAKQIKCKGQSKGVKIKYEPNDGEHNLKTKQTKQGEQVPKKTQNKRTRNMEI
jgi:hypothetical protein